MSARTVKASKAIEDEGQRILALIRQQGSLPLRLNTTRLTNDALHWLVLNRKIRFDKEKRAYVLFKTSRQPPKRMAQFTVNAMLGLVL
jgi:hypothetical protein